MSQDGWGAPRIHAELMKLGFDVSESTVSRYLPRRPSEPDQVKRWVAFLRNHKHDIAAMDLFTVSTASLRLLYGFFIIVAWSPTHLALQRDVSPDRSMGDSAAAGRISLQFLAEIAHL